MTFIEDQCPNLINWNQFLSCTYHYAIFYLDKAGLGSTKKQMQFFTHRFLDNWKDYYS